MQETPLTVAITIATARLRLIFRVKGMEKEQICKKIVRAKISGRIIVRKTSSRRLDEVNSSARKMQIKLWRLKAYTTDDSGRNLTGTGDSSDL